MPECNRCGAMVLFTLKHCPQCQKIVNPAGQDLLVADQPRPRGKGTDRGGPSREQFVSPSPREIFGKPDRIRRRKLQEI
jgi:hypothetical protein